MIFLVIFAGIALKREKIGPVPSSFNPCLSTPSVATHDRKQFQCLKTVVIFGIQLMRKHVLVAFQQDRAIFV